MSQYILSLWERAEVISFSQSAAAPNVLPTLKPLASFAPLRELFVSGKDAKPAKRQRVRMVVAAMPS
jgi:hypothetical protein